MNVRPLACVSMCMILVSIATAQPQSDAIYDSKGFESPTFTLGSLAGQNGWRVVLGEEAHAIVQSDKVAQGQQAVQLLNTGERVLIRKGAAVKENAFVDVMLFTPTADQIHTNASILFRGRDADNKAGLYLNVSLNAGGAVNNVPAGPNNRYTPGAWNRFTVYLDLANNTWDLYVNGKLAAAGLPFTGNADVASFNTFDVDWTSKPGASGFGVGVDQLQITPTNPLPEPAPAG